MPPNSKYETHVKPNLELIRTLRQSGKTEAQIAEKLKIAYSTLSDYKNRYSELREVLLESKDKLVANLKKSLWQEALGYEYEEKQEYIEGIKNKDGTINQDKKKLKMNKSTKKARGVPNLLIFALCNLCPEEFKRVDKSLEDQIKEMTRSVTSATDKLRETITDEKIQKAFLELYPHLKEKEK